MPNPILTERGWEPNPTLTKVLRDRDREPVHEVDAMPAEELRELVLVQQHRLDNYRRRMESLCGAIEALTRK